MGYSIVNVVEGPAIQRSRLIVTHQPEGIEQADCNWIYLPNGKAVLWHADNISVGEKFADDSGETLSTKAIEVFGRIASDGRSIRASDRVADIIVGLLRAPTDKGAALQPSKQRQRFEVILGPNRLLWTEAKFVPPSTKTYADVFSSAGTLSGATSSDGLFTWSHVDGGGTATKGAGVLVIAGSYTGACSADCDTDSMYAQVDFVSESVASSYWIDVSQNGTYPGSGSNGYEGALNGSANQAELYAIASGSFNLLTSGSHTHTAATYRTERDGSTVAVKRNGTTLISATDSSEPTGAGNRKSLLGGDSALTFDNFGYGDIVAGGSAQPPRSMQQFRLRRAA